MSDQEELAGPGGGGGASRFHLLQPNRDPQSNWEVDLAANLEEYLLRICSGEISAADDQDHALHSVNFAEAALLLQGSVQVYSRKVEYLYSLVLHALEFLSQKRQDQQEKTFAQADGNAPDSIIHEEDETFLGLDDVLVEAKNTLDDVHDKEDSVRRIPKPPANLLVLEGDCLDSSGDSGELESYLLATCDFYGDFLLLDPCDAPAVDDFLQTNYVVEESVLPSRGSSVRSKGRNGFFASPTGRSGGSARKSTHKETQGINLDRNLEQNFDFVDNENYNRDYPDHNNFEGEQPNFGCSSVRDDSDDEYEDPWKPLNPHEPGDLKIKPFKKVKAFARRVTCNTKRSTTSSQFPIAKLDGVIIPEFAKSFEVQLSLQKKQQASHSPPLYEKLRRSLTFGEEIHHGFGHFEDENDDAGGDHSPDCAQEEVDVDHDLYHMDADLPTYHDKSDNANFDGVEGFAQDHLDSHGNLEDLCRSHLDSLLASIAETEKQTELAARVSTWRQRIEHTLEEQESHPAFDIHLYGERILDKLSSEADDAGAMPFTNIVLGQSKYEVARTFSALLQLVNDGNVDLQRDTSSNELVCHTSTNPFSVTLINRDKREETESRWARKRLKSPLKKVSKRGKPCVVNDASHLNSPSQSGKFSVKLGKGNVIRCTPEGKRRRRSARFAEPFDLKFAS
ncbi:condensin-2 complex subunit H2 [Ananas comosus]|uniref:Condensin-2 complex subunit H2 n=1 Tax=Ananas comosus TaxID=4615 RepID=A0A6P5FPR0_ANACO|nr:condensin-2 complex subunit H2 [Ananas comosus]